MQYAPTGGVITSVSGFTSLGLSLYATFTCVDTYAFRQGSPKRRQRAKGEGLNLVSVTP